MSAYEKLALKMAGWEEKVGYFDRGDLSRKYKPLLAILPDQILVKISLLNEG